jgi:hypothetical protein
MDPMGDSTRIQGRLAQLRLTGLTRGLLFNFNVPVLVQGIKRIVNGPGLSLSPQHEKENNSVILLLFSVPSWLRVEKAGLAKQLTGHAL